MTETPPDARGAVAWQSATVVKIVKQTSRIKSFFLSLEDPFSFRAGQHVDVRLTGEDGYTAMRSYSIASAPYDMDQIELSIEILDNGEVSPFFHNVVVEGDQIELRGPLGGHFVWRPEDGGPLLLIGGGSGVVPLMSMIRDQRNSGTRPCIQLLLAARTWDDVLYREELLEIDRSQDGFHLTVALSQEQSRRKPDYGRRIDTAMIADVIQRLPESPRFVFICGSNAFVNVAADGTILGGIPAGSIRTERYGGV